MYPKTLQANLQYREQLLRRCQQDIGFAQAVRDECSRDLLFWMNSFLYCYDPREKPNQRVSPFITYPFQDDFFRTMQLALGQEDIVIPKSRTMGVTWMVLALMLHDAQFGSLCSYGLVSAKEELIDKTGDPKALFWKLDFLLKYQPAFLVPKFNRARRHLDFAETGSTFDGEATTENMFRSGRLTAIMMDEVATFEEGDSYLADSSTFAVSNCRIFISTYRGAKGLFYDKCKRAKAGKLRYIPLHWTLHPKYAQGVTYDEYGKASSPWYLKECDRLVAPTLIKSELDMDPEGSESQTFPAALLSKILLQDCRPPYSRGRMVDDGGEWAFIEDDNGSLMLWMFFVDGRPPAGEEYCIGADISAGTGATNSVLSIADRRTGEKVGELATPKLSPEAFADLATAVCRLFNDAFLIWEMNGPGNSFGKQVIANGYRNLYWRQNEDTLEKKITSGLVPGWFSSAKNKDALIYAYIAALSQGRFVNRSREAVDECKLYIYEPSGHITNTRSRGVQDASSARENHGDRPTADALACKAILDLGKGSAAQVADDPQFVEKYPEGSFGWRRQERMNRQKASEDWNQSEPEPWVTTPSAGW